MTDDSNQINQNEIEDLLRQVKDADSAQKPAPPKQPAAAGSDSIDQSEIEALLGGAGKSKPAPPKTTGADGEISQSEIEALLGGGNKPKPATPKPVAAGAEGEISQSEIEALLGGGGKSKPAPAKPAPAKPAQPAAAQAAATKPAAKVAAPPVSSPASDIDLLLRQTQAALSSIDRPVEADSPGISPFSLPEFVGTPPSKDFATLELLRDIELDLKIELGRTEMFLEEILRLRKGSVVPLDKQAGDPVDVYVNGRLVARGEVLVLNDNFCVRVAELIAGNDVD